MQNQNRSDNSGFTNLEHQMPDRLKALLNELVEECAKESDPKATAALVAHQLEYRVRDYKTEPK